MTVYSARSSASEQALVVAGEERPDLLEPVGAPRLMPAARTEVDTAPVISSESEREPALVSRSRQ